LQKETITLKDGLKMHITKVGNLYISGKTQYPEATLLEYTETGPTLLMAVKTPTEKEIKAIRGGGLELALYETEQVLWFLFRIHGFGPWSDAPFSIRLYDDQGKKFDWSEDIGAGMGIGLQMVLLDAQTGIVKALRLVAMPTEFSRQFRAVILRQTERPFSKDNYFREINRIYDAHSSEDLVKRSSVKCRLGE
jgi:hypothetical protein